MGAGRVAKMRRQGWGWRDQNTRTLTRRPMGPSMYAPTRGAVRMPHIPTLHPPGARLHATAKHTHARTPLTQTYTNAWLCFVLINTHTHTRTSQTQTHTHPPDRSKYARLAAGTAAAAAAALLPGGGGGGALDVAFDGCCCWAGGGGAGASSAATTSAAAPPSCRSVIRRPPMTRRDWRVRRWAGSQGRDRKGGVGVTWMIC